jgi:hypothetical protein
MGGRGGGSEKKPLIRKAVSNTVSAAPQSYRLRQNARFSHSTCYLSHGTHSEDRLDCRVKVELKAVYIQE